MPLGDISSALLPASHRRRRRSSPGPTACSPAPPAPPRLRPARPGRRRRPGTAADGDAVDRRRHRRRRSTAPWRRSSPASGRPSTSSTTSPASPPSPAGSSTPPHRRPGPRLGHPQDHARAARAREGGGAGRRRLEPPRQPLGVGDVQGQPPRPPRHRRRREAGPGALAGPHGPRRGGLARQGRRRPSRPGPTRSSSTTSAPTRSARRRARRSPRRGRAAPTAARGERGHHPRDDRRLRRHRRRRHHQSAQITISAPVLDIGDSTSASCQLTVGCVLPSLPSRAPGHRRREHPDRDRPVRTEDGEARRNGAERELVDHWRIATTAERTSRRAGPARAGVPRLPRLQLRRGHRRRRPVLVGAVDHRRPSGR